MIKHIGRMSNNGRKVIVAYKVVPNEPDQCIIVTTENLMSEEHDTLINLVESPAGQEADDLATVMARTPLPDGRNMLAAFHTTGKMIKVPTNTVEMTPTTKTTIMLNELNELIAQQKGVSIEDLAMKGPTDSKSETKTEEVVAETVTATTTNEVLSDEDLARQYRSQADSLYKEAKRLRDEAEKLSPTKKSAKKTKESA